MLRSSIMKIWPGMEVRTYGIDKVKPLGFVRHERIAEDVLLCIVEGNISEIELREPPEGLHFGVHDPSSPDKKGKISFTKKIRGHKEVEYITENHGVIRIVNLAGKIKEELTSEAFNSAIFSYNMVEPVASVKLSLGSSKKAGQDGK
jgi:hypothetical protein